MDSRASLVIAVGLVCGACGGEGSAPPPPEAATATLLPEAPPPRRPTRRYYLARTPDRCEIFSEDGEDRTEPVVTPCPDFMLIGERIRVAGMTCTLENKAQSEREKPVVCPDPLIHFEKTVRADAGAPSAEPSVEAPSAAPSGSGLEPDAGTR